VTSSIKPPDNVKQDPQIEYIDRFGLAAIHSCAILGKLDKSAIHIIKAHISGRITMRDLMSLKTIGERQDLLAAEVFSRCNSIIGSEDHICGVKLYPLNLGTLNVQLLHKRFGGQNQSSGPTFQNSQANRHQQSNLKPKEDGELFLKQYYLPFAYEKAAFYKSKCKDSDEDLFGVITDKYVKVMPLYDPLKGYALTTFLESRLDGAAKNELERISRMRTRIKTANEQWDNATDSWESEPGGGSGDFDSTNATPDGTKLSIPDKTADPKASDPSKDACWSEITRARKKATAQLSKKHQIAVKMLGSGCKKLEVASALGLKPQTVTETIMRARRRLRWELKKSLREEI